MPFTAETALRRLKAFQRRTVDYVMGRFYHDADPTTRFLVADEVGLGKTMVARGVIARTIEHLWDTIDRIDVLYICSNQAIASQNLNRLNVLDRQALALPTRMTLLPLQLTGEYGLDRNKVNFISLTPGTTFNLRSRTGVRQERALLYHLLRDGVALERGLYNLLQVGAGAEGWRWEVEQTPAENVDQKLAEGFRDACRDEGLFQELGELCRRFYWRLASYPADAIERRNRLIGRLRNRLAHASIGALEPDLIILDEFQRFTELLKGDHAAAILAQEIFDYVSSKGNAARTLLLSATPYRMLTLVGDTENDGHHYQELLEVLGFLFGPERGPAVVEDLGRELDRFRRAILSLPSGKAAATDSKSSIEGRLRGVMTRTERVGSTLERDAMVTDVCPDVSVRPKDLRSAAALAHVARLLEVPDIIEYWKSAPYLLNFMRDYALKRAMADRVGQHLPEALRDALRDARSSCLSRRVIEDYRPLDPPNGRMRQLMDDVFNDRLDQRLWIPPSLPYYRERNSKIRHTSKALVFSSWAVVPDAVAAVLSYEAERRMGVKDAGMGYYGPRPRPLQFRKMRDRLTGLRALLMIYPSALIARVADPLDVVAARAKLLPYGHMRAALAARLQPYVEQLQRVAEPSAEHDSWRWGGPAVLDALQGNQCLAWLEDEEDGLVSLGREEAWRDHVVELRNTARQRRIRGAPNSAINLLVDLALGSPAICALRALRRVAPELAWDDPVLLTAASRVAWGFRTLYNQHDTVALLRRGGEDRYWRNAIAYGARHNLQAVLDEYVHCLVELEGLTDAEPHHRVGELAQAIRGALSLLPSQIEADEPRIRSASLHLEKFTMRGRFAMRLADYRDEEGSAARLSGVRDAFNSPFRPFVLASTSIGQEGLDFHPYCRRIYHWNLPRNPVDLEQREGRVHRYKGHAIRLNVAACHEDSVRGCGEAPPDPWTALFEAARGAAPVDNDLVPYWVCGGPAKVERRVPLLPFSREVTRLSWLKKSVAVYRLTFGQPRQEDLLAYLANLDESLDAGSLEGLQIRLEPDP